MRAALVVGAGRIGTSVALSLRAAGIGVHLADTDRRALRLAASLGAGSPAAPLGPVDIAVLALPPDQVAGVLGRLQKDGAARSYTDVSSVRLPPQREAMELSCDMTSYVGGHPLAGHDDGRSGPLAARAGLFRDRPWVLTPTEATDRRALNQVLELVALSGATPVVVDAAGHDEAMARIAHLPRLVAALLAGRLMGGGHLADRLRDESLRDATRLAAGDPALWATVLAGNAAAVRRCLERLDADIHEALDALRAAAEGGDERERAGGVGRVRGILDRGARAHRRMPAFPPGTVAATVSVAVADRAGELGRLLAGIAATGVNAHDIALRPAAPDEGHLLGTAEVTLAAHEAAELAEALRAGGWPAAPPLAVPAPRPLEEAATP
jgi:prephenate dehydrogenase